MPLQQAGFAKREVQGTLPATPGSHASLRLGLVRFRAVQTRWGRDGSRGGDERGQASVSEGDGGERRQLVARQSAEASRISAAARDRARGAR